MLGSRDAINPTDQLQDINQKQVAYKPNISKEVLL